MEKGPINQNKLYISFLRNRLQYNYMLNKIQSILKYNIYIIYMDGYIYIISNVINIELFLFYLSKG